MSFLSNYGAVAALAAALFILFNKKKEKGEKPVTTTQELIRYKNISPGGAVELPNHQYRMVIEVEPVNMALKSHSEQESLWLGFRDLVNALTIPATFLVQSRHLDFKDYIAELQKEIGKAPTPELQEYGRILCNELGEKTEKNVRDRRHYIILKIDALAVSSIDSGIKLDNEAINALLSDLKPKRGGHMSDKEISALAVQELDNLAGVIQGCLSGMEIPNIRLGRDGVIDLIYSTFNRDLSPHARLVDAGVQDMFSPATYSLTPLLGSELIEESAGKNKSSETGKGEKTA
ncbi:hypothetical protein DCCM_4600 [Desulfocucumis palustris]|uniref:TraC-like domain-containing protein n=1 Tax=Desulfocucumis palustris TaxID=1898651 RepID=A0A2L2XND1_9FIRM|nr:hypothetical protein [Desulfocucumis palustris]GBF35471.1 hypothetical protein DCCM_4600 [Desulfocucumis palustris]